MKKNATNVTPEDIEVVETETNDTTTDSTIGIVNVSDSADNLSDSDNDTEDFDEDYDLGVRKEISDLKQEMVDLKKDIEQNIFTGSASMCIMTVIICLIIFLMCKGVGALIKSGTADRQAAKTVNNVVGDIPEYEYKDVTVTYDYALVGKTIGNNLHYISLSIDKIAEKDDLMVIKTGRGCTIVYNVANSVAKIYDKDGNLYEVLNDATIKRETEMVLE